MQDALTELAEVLTEAGRFEELAQMYAERASSSQSPDERVELLVALASLLLDHFDDPEQALRALLEALYQRPSDDDVAMRIEQIAKSRDSWAPVFEAVNTWVTSSNATDRVSLCVRAANWYADLGHIEWGAAHVEKARSLAPADVRVARVFARLVATTGPLDGLEAARRRVLELDPSDRPALDGLEDLHRGAATLDQYAAFLEGLVRGSGSGRLNPTRLQLARVLTELGNEVRAIVVLEEAWAADRTDTQVLRALDVAYEKAGRSADLQKVLEARVLHDREANRTELTLRIARVLEDEFLDPDRAAAKLKEHIGRDPDAADAYVALAKLHGKRRRWDRALDTLELAAEVLSDPIAAADANLQIARIRLDELNDAAGAIEALEAGRKMDSGNDGIGDLLARAYEKAGDVDRALSAMVGVAHRKEDPGERADALVLAANAFRARVGDWKKARRLYQEAVRNDPAHIAALTELRAMAMDFEAFEEAAQYLDRLQRHTVGDAPRAKFLIELGVLRRERLADTRGALHAFEEALALDADNDLAGMPVAESYFAAGRLDEAATILARLAGTTRKPDAQSKILTLQGRVATARGAHNIALDAFKRAVRLGDKRPEVLDALAKSALAAGHPVEALSAQKSLVATLPPESGATLAAALIRLGEIKLSLGDLRGASHDFEQALAMDPGSRRATESVVQIAVDLKAWEHVDLWEQRLLELVHDADERRAILRRSADRWAKEVQDLRRAIRSLSGLLELDPTDRAVLHEILAHRQELKDFRGVANTIEFIVALDPDRARRAKYLIAAAKVHRDELKDEERALTLFERALDDDPTALEAFQSIDAALTAAKDFQRLERAYRKMILRVRPLGTVDLEFTLWHALGLIYRDRLGQPDAAVEAFRMATQLRPDDAQERRIVAEIYESVDRTDLAIAELRTAIERDPMAIEHHRALHALHLRRRDRERAFITASTLVVLGGADEDARNLCEAERPRGMPSYGARLLPGYFRQLLAHEELDAGISAILNAVARAARVAKARGTSLPRGSLPPRKREDPDAPSHPASVTFFRVAQVLGLTPPKLHLRTDLPGAFAPIALEEPTSVIGSSLLEGWGERELTFLAGKHLASIEGEHGVRAHFPAKTELRAMLLAAVSLGLGTTAPATGSTGPEDITRIARVLGANLTADEGRILRGLVGRFAESSGRADVDRWMQCSELTSLRAGLVACGDLITTVQLLRMESGVAGDLSVSDKIRDLVRFAVSERHFELRRMIEIDLREPISYVTRTRAACA